METQASQTLTLQVICLALPLDATDHPIEFGLQDKAQQVHGGVSLPDETLRFRCAIKVRLSAESAAPDFVGPFVHGTQGARFLYLSLRQQGARDWLRRIKIPLAGIGQHQVVSALQSGGMLTARIPTDKSGTIVLSDGWQVSKEKT